ncbi:hypothetical protein PILCRDRAFT_241534 [Piloderma croceum F 1598]|uniref:Uncharacterized protein n=1 Tax=Piloderma croceum (strain F 1598) TaxID=765440 RepID=A0A0C3GDY6_PILCF|nr:hypothetical protein PILCRDRAFT_241534 [Piloderma croceum F 1598]
MESIMACARFVHGPADVSRAFTRWRHMPAALSHRWRHHIVAESSACIITRAWRLPLLIVLEARWKRSGINSCMLVYGTNPPSRPRKVSIGGVNYKYSCGQIIKKLVAGYGSLRP